MNYRHAYHAGNFADVLKHAALVAAISYLKKKETPFAVIDTHAGRGLYDLTATEGRKTDESESGIRRLLQDNALPGVLGAYIAIVREFGEGVYPGSPLIAAQLIRPQDRLIAIEKHPEEFAALATALATVKNARAVEGDGYAALKQLLPPPERRGIILIDPPFEEPDEFRHAASSVIGTHRRFATGIVLFWYPKKDKAALDAAIGEILNAGARSLLKIELDIGASPCAAVQGAGPPLRATGLLVVNPPFGFADQMQTILPYLVQRLGRSSEARFDLVPLAGQS